MEIEFDPKKRLATLQTRGVDMEDVPLVFAGPTLTVLDDRQDYGEKRYITIGLLRRRMFIVVWTPRGAAYRIISMRKANAREQKAYGAQLARS